MNIFIKSSLAGFTIVAIFVSSTMLDQRLNTHYLNQLASAEDSGGSDGGSGDSGGSDGGGSGDSGGSDGGGSGDNAGGDSGGSDGCGGCGTPGQDTGGGDNNQNGGDTPPPPPPPPETWTPYCTGGSDPNGNNWQWWEVSNYGNYRFLRNGDGSCVPPPAAPVCVIDVTPATVSLGSAVNIYGSTANAASASLNQGIGGTAVNNTFNVSHTPTSAGTITYTLTVQGVDGSTINCSDSVTVTVAPVLPSCVLTASPKTVQTGGSTTLTWTTNNATAASIDQGIGAVTLGTNQTLTRTNLTSNITYTMTVTNSAGQQATCSDSVTVTSVPPAFSCANNVTFTASRSSIDEGESTTLSWNVTGATSVSIDNGVNTTGVMSGNVDVSPSRDTTFTLTASNGTTPISCPLLISVDEDDDNGGGGGGGSSSPRCELTASDKKIKSGDRVTLRWDTSRATSVELRDNRGNILATTKGLLGSKKEDLYDDTLVVRPTRDTTYTLTAARGSRDRECTVKVDVTDNVTVVRDQQPVIISLTDVPYTGIDAKLAIQLSLLGLLVLWGGYLAYGFHRRNRGVGKKAVPENLLERLW